MASDRSSASTRAARLGLIVGSFLLVFAAGEIFVRIVIENARVPVEPKDEGPAVPEEPDLPVFHGTLPLGGKNVRGVHKRVLFRSNSQGLRGPDYTAAPGPGVFRIAIGGDSVTMGEGVEESSSYSRQLEDRLNERPGERRYEVLNVGLSGADASHVMERLTAAADHYRPHMLVYGFTVNDIEGPSYVEGERRNELVKAIQENPLARSPSRLIRVLWWRLQSFRDPPDPREDWYSKELHRNFFENPAAWADFEKALDRFRALAEEHSACGQVFIHTHLAHLDERHPFADIYDRVGEAARRRGLAVITTLDVFEGRHPPDLWVGFFDPHPNREGHAMLAERLAEGLSALPGSCWERRPDAG